MSQKRIAIEREFNAPIQKVWNAWTKPEIIAKWWAPDGLVNHHASITELKPGGLFRYCMKNSQTGEEYWGRGIYQKVIEPTYLSYLDSFTDAEGNDVPPSFHGLKGDEIEEYLVELVLEEKNGMTNMKLIMDGGSDEKHTEMALQGWNSMLDLMSNVIQD